MVVRTKVTAEAVNIAEEDLSPEENVGLVEEVEVEEVTEEVGLALLERLEDVDARTWMVEVRTMVESALVKQHETIASQEEEIREQGVSLARLEQELRHRKEMLETREALANETTRRVKATNRNLRTALEERDRRLVVFARKLAKVRNDRDDHDTTRAMLIEELKNLSWYQGSRRKAILEQLEEVN